MAVWRKEAKRTSHLVVGLRSAFLASPEIAAAALLRADLREPHARRRRAPDAPRVRPREGRVGDAVSDGPYRPDDRAEHGRHGGSWFVHGPGLDPPLPVGDGQYGKQRATRQAELMNLAYTEGRRAKGAAA